MKSRRLTITYLQIFAAILLLFGCLATPEKNSFICRPFLCCALMIAFGTAQLRMEIAGNVKNEVRSDVKRLMIVDLFVYVAFVAIVIAHARSLNDYNSSFLDICGWFIPPSITLWIHWRQRLSSVSASAVHYVVSLGWAFFLGYVFVPNYKSHYYNQGAQISPVSEGLNLTAQMIEFGFYTSTSYFVLTTIAEVLMHVSRREDLLSKESTLFPDSTTNTANDP